MDLALNNLQRLICHKNPPNQTKPNQATAKRLARKTDGTGNRRKNRDHRDWLEYSEVYWRSEETCRYSDSGENPSFTKIS